MIRGTGWMGEEEEGSKRREWTPEKEDMFFENLGETCNVRKAALAAGVDPRRAYARRGRDPAFAQRWCDVRATAFLRLEERLIRDSLGEFDEEAGEREMTQSERELALNLLKFHNGAVGGPRSSGTPPRRAAQEETDAAILAKLAALKRRLERERDETPE